MSNFLIMMKIINFCCLILFLSITLISHGLPTRPQKASNEIFTTTSSASGLEPITLVTDDNIKLSAVIGVPEVKKDKYPALIFIHQGGSNKNEWVNTTVFKQFLCSGYVVLAYDIRTFGKSEHDEAQSNIYNDPNRATRDLMAALAYLREDRKDIASKNIGVIGASIGGNLACVAAANKKYAIKTAVAISCKTAAINSLANNNKNLKMKSVFVISSEHDQGGKRAAWAKELYNLTAEPRKITIVPGSSAHGVSMLNQQVSQEIVSWVDQTMR